MAQRLRVEQERSDVLEDDPRLREVGDVADVVAKVYEAKTESAEDRGRRMTKVCALMGICGGGLG
jgi:hypothetical protein